MVVWLCAGCAGCKDDKPRAVPSSPAPIAVTDPKTVKSVDDLLHAPAEPATAATKAAAKDPTPIVGEWKIRNMQSKINGKLSALDEPIMPGSWVLGKDASFAKKGGNEFEGTFVFTGDHLVVSAFGPAIDYQIKTLTKTEMVLVTRIEGVDIENTTFFDRK